MNQVKILSNFFLMAIIFNNAKAQVQSLVAAEKAFSSLSKDKGTKQAFLANLADSGLVFHPNAVNGKQFWQQQAEDNSLLTWQPVVADIAASGDLGYTTGPFKQFQNKTDEQPAGSGSYVTLWKKEKGEWKVALDMGIGHQPAPMEAESFKEDKINIKKKADAKIEITGIEAEFIKQQNEKGLNVYQGFISPGVRLYRPMSIPYITEEQRNKLLTATDKKFTYENIGGDVASSADLAYMYGKVKIEITANANIRSLNGNYLRIWKKEDGKNWKIVLDLVNTPR